MTVPSAFKKFLDQSSSLPTHSHSVAQDILLLFQATLAHTSDSLLTHQTPSCYQHVPPLKASAVELVAWHLMERSYPDHPPFMPSFQQPADSRHFFHQEAK